MTSSSFRRPTLFRRRAFGLVAITALCACQGPEEGVTSCTGVILFGPFLAIELEPRSEAWAPGVYHVAVAFDGREEACDVALESPSCPAAPEPSCTSRYLNFRADCDRTEAGELGPVRVRVVLTGAAPASLRLAVTRDGEPFVDESIAPAYTIHEDRGPTCEGPVNRNPYAFTSVSAP